MSEAFRIGIAGLGTVGTGVVKILQKNGAMIADRAGRPIEIVTVSARSKKDRGVDLSKYKWADNPESLADEKLDAVIELMGGAEGTARNLVTKSLQNKKHVVTANKALLANHGFELASLAEKNDVNLMYEASVAGCVPIIRAMREGFTSNKVTGVYGILNGTCNYILTQMRLTGRDFKEVLKEAQAKGYAEADPAADVEGTDAGHKTAILAAIAYGVKPDFKSVKLKGITRLSDADIQFAGKLGYKIKLIGISKDYGGKIVQSVEPCLVPADDPLGSIEDVYNAVFVEGDYFETPLLTGRGAGEGPTASAVVADIVNIARGAKVPTFGIPASKLKDMKVMDLGETQSRFYLRMEVLDKPGVIADISAILRDQNISIESVLQQGRDPGQPVNVVMTTHESLRKNIAESCKQIAKLDCSIGEPVLLRVVVL
jgi:homoserine dehydrogenase